MVVGDKNKKGRKKEKEGRGFGRLPSFFFPPFLFVFLTVCFLVVVLRCGDCGPNLVVFWGFDWFRVLGVFNYSVARWVTVHGRVYIAQKLSTIRANESGGVSADRRIARMIGELTATHDYPKQLNIEGVHITRNSILTTLRTHPPTRGGISRNIRDVLS